MKSQIASSKSKEESGPKKYLKRSEVEAQRQADYQREQEELERARLERLDKKRKREEEEAEQTRAREEKKRRLAEESKKLQEQEDEAEESARRRRLGLPPLEKKIDSTLLLKEGEEDLSEEDLLAKLQQLGEPRFLFGETHVERLRRYRKITQKALAPKLTTGPIPTTLELVPEAEMRVPETVPKDLEGKRFLRRQLASYFDMLLSEWQFALARRSKEVKESSTGKTAFNSFLAARDNLRPLFKKLENDDFPEVLLAPVLEIVNLAQLKRYVAANDAYLRVSIGKAAWPIGVTMVGIHERSAREKLHETEKTGNQAHILSDEVTRKMLQGIKRCLSYAQVRWPPEDIGQLMG